MVPNSNEGEVIYSTEETSLIPYERQNDEDSHEEVLNISQVGVVEIENVVSVVGEQNEGGKRMSIEEGPVLLKRAIVSIDVGKYKLPKNFGTVLNRKLKEKVALTENEYSDLCRRLADSVEEQTCAPNTQSLTYIVSKLFANNGHLMMDPNDPISSTSALVKKLQRIMSRRRKNAGMQLSKVVGRSRKENPTCVMAPGVVTSSDNCYIASRAPEVDMRSYSENVAKLIELFQSSGNSASINSLWKITFRGRRFEITKGITPRRDDVLMKCPVSNQPDYMLNELELILGEGTCQKFRENWLRAVPVILNLAMESKNATVKNISRNLHSSRDSDSFDERSSSALQLLILLMRTKTKAEKVHFLLDIIEDSVNIAEAIKKPKRTMPFLLNTGKSYILILNNEPLLQISTNSM